MCPRVRHFNKRGTTAEPVVGADVTKLLHQPEYRFMCTTFDSQHTDLELNNKIISHSGVEL